MYWKMGWVPSWHGHRFLSSGQAGLTNSLHHWPWAPLDNSSVHRGVTKESFVRFIISMSQLESEKGSCIQVTGTPSHPFFFLFIKGGFSPLTLYPSPSQNRLQGYIKWFCLPIQSLKQTSPLLFLTLCAIDWVLKCPQIQKDWHPRTHRKGRVFGR